MLEEIAINNLTKNIKNNFIKNIEFAKEYCAKNRMILVRIDVPPHIYYALEKCCYNLEPIQENNIVGHFEIERLCGVSINVNIHIEKPQYIMEMNNDD